MFYTFRQNNSGGHFTHRPSDGIGKYVIIEADSDVEANRKAESIGLYFDGVSEGRDCSCCGDRWYRSWESNEQPSVYDEPVKLKVRSFKGEFISIHPDGEYIGIIVYIHYKDGTMKLGLYED